jgi:hypothetical protein
MIFSKKSAPSNLLIAPMFAAALLVSPVALAHGGGGGGMSGSHGDFGGNSLGNMSAQGKANTNGPNAADRDFGHERVADRHAFKHGHRHHGNGKSREEIHESATAEIHEH